MDKKIGTGLGKLVDTVVNGAASVTGAVIGGKPLSKSKGKEQNRAKLLVSVVNRGDEIRLKEILDEISIALGFTFAGTGTAHSAVLDYLGIGETEKSIVVSLFPESDEEAVMRGIRSRMSLYLVGKGISFTIPLSGVSEIVANGLGGAASVKMGEGGKS